MRAAVTILWSTAAVAAVTLGAGGPWWSGLVLLGFAALLERAGAGLLPPDMDATDGAPRLVGRVVVGAAAAIVLGTVGAWTPLGTRGGGGLLVLLAVWGLVRARTRGPAVWQWPEAATAAIGTVAGLWLHAAQGARWGDRLWFNDRYGDYGSHLHNAELLRTYGLPLVEPSGGPDTPWSPLLNAGLPALAAVVRDLTALPPAAVARGLGVGAMVLLALAAASTAVAWGASTARARWVGVGVLAWGGLGWLPAAFSALGSHDLAGLRAAATDAYASGLATGATFHNLTQAWSLVFSLVAVGWAAQAWRGGSRDLLIACGAGIGVGAMVKPGLVVVLAPAMVIVLVARRNLKDLLWFLAGLTPLLLLHALPTFVGDLPPSHPWALATESPWPALAFAAGLLAVTGPAWLDWMRGAWARLRRGQSEGSDLWALSLAGAVLFAVLFREGDEARRSHGNERWPLLGMAVLALPMAAGFVQLPRRRPVRVFWAAVLALHLLAGTLYLRQYPRIGLRSLPLAETDELVSLVQTAPAGPGLVQPEVAWRDVRPDLARPLPSFVAHTASSERWWIAWRDGAVALENGAPLKPDAQTLLNRARWLVLRTDAVALHKAAARMGFSRQSRGVAWQRWTRRL